MSDFAINAQNISKYYKLYNSPADRLKEALSPTGKAYHKKYYALRDINLSVKKGELLGIVGKNGCGKSTLLKIISGVLTPDSGNVRINGKLSALLELGSGFNPEFTGLQNIYFYGVILGFKREEIDLIVDDILSFADIGEYINQPIKTYSSGMKARLSFSVATVIEPEILILDEILSVGDALFRRKCTARMQTMMNSGCTVLLVSHSEESINRLCTKAVYIRDGEIVLSGLPKHVTKFYLKVSDSSRIISNREIQKEMEAIKCGDEGESSEGLSPGPTVSPGVDEAFFSEQVKGLSQPVITSNFPVELLSAEVISISNKTVNVLEYGGVYKLVLKYIFKEDAENVVFPIAILSSEGQLLSGIRNPDDGSRVDIKCNTEIELIYEFECAFLQGTFYLNIAVRQLIGEEKNYLWRADDVLCFKVQDHSRKEHWGIFSSGVYKMRRNIIEVE
jgi:lipopolysaccharide transport system ATP-binding protein